MKEERGFTLIELLAVIIILGIIMLIAIPGVTRYITDSRKKAYVNTATQIVKGAIPLINGGELDVYDSDTTYYIPSSCVPTENNLTSPYGDFTNAYVIVGYTGEGFVYYWASTDTAKQGIEIKKSNDLMPSDVKPNIDEIEPTIGIDSRKYIQLLDNSNCNTFGEKVIATRNINENGEIESKISTLIEGPQFNKLIKQIAGNQDATTGTHDQFVKKFMRSFTAPEEGITTTVISTDYSEYETIAWFDNGTVYWYSDAQKIYLNEDSSWMFSYFINMTSLELNYFVTTRVKSLKCTFNHLYSLLELDVSTFDTRKLESMQQTFSSCYMLEEVDLSNWDMSHVTIMTNLFGMWDDDGYAYINNKLKRVIFPDNIDTSKVAYMGFMFAICTNLEEVNVSNFNTSNVVSMYGMFELCYKLKNLDLSRWNTSKVVDMGRMFQRCKSLESVNLSNFNTANVKSMSFMFSSCHNLTTIDLSSFDSSNLTDITYMFAMFTDEGTTYLDAKLTSIIFSNKFKIEKVTNLSRVFANCAKLTNLNLSYWNPKNVTIADRTFQNCKSLVNLDLSNWDTSSLENTQGMFVYCYALKNLDISNWNTNKLKQTNAMFASCTELEHIYISNTWNTSNIDNSLNMFKAAAKLPNYNDNIIDITNAHAGPGGYLTLKTN